MKVGRLSVVTTVDRIDGPSDWTIERAAHLLPSQGDRMPWKVYQNYLLDLILLRHGRLEDGSLEFR